MLHFKKEKVRKFLNVSLFFLQIFNESKFLNIFQRWLKVFCIYYLLYLIFISIASIIINNFSILINLVYAGTLVTLELSWSFLSSSLLPSGL